VDAKNLPSHLRALKIAGVPYTDEEIKNSANDVYGKTEMEAIVAFLQVLGATYK